jgi:hypothetical protein
VTDDPAIDTASRTGKLVMGILSLIAEFENDIRRERQMDGIKQARERGSSSVANHYWSMRWSSGCEACGRRARQCRSSCGKQTLARQVFIVRLALHENRISKKAGGKGKGRARSRGY